MTREPVSTSRRSPSSAWFTRTSSHCPTRSARTSSGQDHLRASDQGQSDAEGVGPVQAAGHLRQRGGNRQDQEACSSGWPDAAGQGAQYGSRGRTVIEVRRAAREAVSLIEAAFDAGLVVEGSASTWAASARISRTMCRRCIWSPDLPRSVERRLSQVKILDTAAASGAVRQASETLPHAGQAAQRRVGSAVSRRHGIWRNRDAFSWRPPARWWPP